MAGRHLEDHLAAMLSHRDFATFFPMIDSRARDGGLGPLIMVWWLLEQGGEGWRCACGWLGRCIVAAEVRHLEDHLRAMLPHWRSDVRGLRTCHTGSSVGVEHK